MALRRQSQQLPRCKYDDHLLSCPLNCVISVNAGYPVQCVEFLDTATIKAINAGGSVSKKYPERDSLFFKFQGYVLRPDFRT